MFIGNRVAFSNLWSAFVNLVTYSPTVSPVLYTQFLYSNCHRFISAVVVNFVRKSCLNAIPGVNILLQATIIAFTLLYHCTAGPSNKLAAMWIFLASPHLFAKAALSNCSIHSVGSSPSYPENLPQDATLYSLIPGWFIPPMTVASCAKTLFNPSFPPPAFPPPLFPPPSPSSPPPPLPVPVPPPLFLFLLLCDICCCSDCCSNLCLLANSLAYLSAFLFSSSSVSRILLLCSSSLLLSSIVKISSLSSFSLSTTVGVFASSVFSFSSELSNSLFRFSTKNPRY